MNPTEALRESLDALEKRLRVLEVPGSRLDPSAWNEYEAKFPGVIPVWYKELLRDYPLIDVYLDLPDYDGASWGRKCSMRSPRQKIFCIEDDEQIVPHGWFPFAEENDGNYWAMKANGAVDSPIILINHSRGGLDTPDGTVYAAHCLAHLLSLAAISNARYQHLTSAGFVDTTKSGFMLWGDPDAYTAEHGIKTAEELRARALGKREGERCLDGPKGTV